MWSGFAVCKVELTSTLGLWIVDPRLDPSEIPCWTRSTIFSPISARENVAHLGTHMHTRHGWERSNNWINRIKWGSHGIYHRFAVLPKQLLCASFINVLLTTHRSVPIRTHTVPVKAKGGLLGPTLKICQKIGWKRWNSGATLLWFATWDANMSAKSQSPERAEQLHALMRRASNRKEITVFWKGYDMLWNSLCMRLCLGR